MNFHRLLALALCWSHAVLAQSDAGAPNVAPSRSAQAQAAYEAKDYATCATRYLEAAETASSRSRKLPYVYNAACCQALANHADDAFATLARAEELGLSRAAEVKGDADLAPLAGDPRFAALLQRVAKHDLAVEQAAQPALRDELITMVKVDQEARMALVAKMDDKALQEKLTKIDRTNTARLKAIVKKYGWPGYKLVGQHAAHGAWLLVQHADLDVPFQREALAKLQQAVQRKDADPIDMAYLEDRLAVADKKPQRYGTQFAGNYPDFVPQPIEDEAHVDERRQAIGLESMADYTAQMLETYAPR